MKKFLCAILALAFTSVIAFGGCNIKDKDDALFEPCVTYKEFGAKGDGKTDDFAAIKKAHEHANKNGVAVKADKGAKYYIGAVEDTVTVKTSVDWSGAEFIIDDKAAAPDSRAWSYWLFRVKPDKEPKKLEVPEGFKLSAGQKNVGLTFEKEVMLALYNDGKTDFIRFGYNGQGAPRQEIILVDKDGNVDPSTPIQWDYTAVTRITQHSTDDEPLMLRGGKFTTVANDEPYVKNYYTRGILVERSNVTVKGVEHYVTEEGATGSPYSGFFRAAFADNVAFESCVMTGHKLYKNQSGGDQGTYDTSLLSCNDVRYINCTQSNDHTDPTYWGIMCSDFCKNLYMTGCKLSRFDAHQGVYNATVTDCDIGQNISVVGGGLLKIENVIRRCKSPAKYFNRFVTLRADYGSFFYGDVIIKNSKLITNRGINYVFAGSWYDWDFGYPCVLPKNVTLDNITVEYEGLVDTYVHPHTFVFSHFTETKGETPEFAAASKNPPTLTENVFLKNNSTVFKISANTMGWFADTKITDLGND